MNVKDREWDIHHTKESLLRQLEIMDEWCITQSNREKIETFFKRTEIEGIGIVQRSKYIWALKTLLSAKPKDFGEITKEDLEDFLLSMKEKYKPKTQSTRWFSLTKFFRYIGKEAILEKLKPKFNFKSGKLPEELLTEEEVHKMIKKEPQIRNKAFIAVLYESGCRIGEILTRRIKHVVFDDYGAVMMVDGKTGMRRIRLIESVPLLANYIAHHPVGDPESFLWINIRDYRTPIGHQASKKVLENAAERVGVKKKIHPHLFRHSRATHMAKHLTEQQLKIYFGWVGDSKMASVYVHLSGKDVDNAILELHGIKPPERTQENGKPITCPRCSTQNMSSAKLCGKCGMVLDIRAAMNIPESEGGKFQEFMREMYEKWKNR